MKLAVSQLCFVTKYSKPLLLRLYMFYMYECSLQNLPKWGRRQVRMVCGWLYTYIVPDAFITLTHFLNTLLVYFLNAYLKHLSQSWTFTQVSNFFLTLQQIPNSHHSCFICRKACHRRYTVVPFPIFLGRYSEKMIVTVKTMHKTGFIIHAWVYSSEF